MAIGLVCLGSGKDKGLGRTREALGQCCLSNSFSFPADFRSEKWRGNCLQLEVCRGGGACGGVGRLRQKLKVGAAYQNPELQQKICFQVQDCDRQRPFPTSYETYQPHLSLPHPLKPAAKTNLHAICPNPNPNLHKMGGRKIPWLGQDRGEGWS